jgi:hypothetical protein
MRKGSKHTPEARQKASDSQRRRYAAMGGLPEEHRQNISVGKRRHDAEVARMVAVARAVLSGQSYGPA